MFLWTMKYWIKQNHLQNTCHVQKYYFTSVCLAESRGIMIEKKIKWVLTHTIIQVAEAVIWKQNHKVQFFTISLERLSLNSWNFICILILKNSIFFSRFIGTWEISKFPSFSSNLGILGQKLMNYITFYKKYRFSTIGAILRN